MIFDKEIKFEKCFTKELENDIKSLNLVRDVYFTKDIEKTEYILLIEVDREKTDIES